MAGESSTAQQRWELENVIPKNDPSDIEALYKWDPQEQRKIQQEKPWTKDPHYFKRCVKVIMIYIHTSKSN